MISCFKVENCEPSIFHTEAKSSLAYNIMLIFSKINIHFKARFREKLKSLHYVFLQSSFNFIEREDKFDIVDIFNMIFIINVF